MTDLTKAVRRTSAWPAPHGVAPRVVISLYPGAIIGLREYRRRKEIKLAASTLYAQALLAERRAARRKRAR
jgi:hypothetical protein